MHSARVLLVASLAGLGILTPRAARAQALHEIERLAGVEEVDTRVEAAWDAAITMDAGGATEGQFLEALRAGFREALASADPAPRVLDGAAVTIACHVDTFYDTGLIIYSLRTQLEAPGLDGARVITWIRSWVGSFTTRQLHLMFTLGEQCAESFLEEWTAAN